MKYIATFYSHFGAVRFKKLCEKKGYWAKLMPVPRNLSSSCGTCVSFEIETENMENARETVTEIISEASKEELEQIVRECPEGYETLYKALDS